MSADVIPFPSATVGALRCPVDAEEFRAQNRIELFPNKRNRWLMSLRIRDDATEEQVMQAVVNIFRTWVSLFPGPIQGPFVRVQAPEAPNRWNSGPLSRNVLIDVPASTPPEQMRGPQRMVIAEFDYAGEAESMGLPTFVQRRRERIDPTCPVPPFDAAPWAAMDPPGDATRIVKPVEPHDRITDPFDLGLPQLDLEGLGEDFETTLKTALLTAAGLGLGVILFQLYMSQKRRG